MKCKLTNKDLKPFMSFGKMPLANGFLDKNQFDKEYFFNMEIGFSEELSLFQLNDHPRPEKMFNDTYPFFTGSSEYMKLHFKKFSGWIKSNFLKSNSKLIEIGSNDGTFLNNFKDSEIDYVGFEPSKNVALKAKKNNIKTINSFFNRARQIILLSFYVIFCRRYIAALRRPTNQRELPLESHVGLESISEPDLASSTSKCVISTLSRFE